MNYLDPICHLPHSKIFMQEVALPVKVYNNLNKLNRNFLWGSLEELKTIHLIGWSKLVKPKGEGGLGV